MSVRRIAISDLHGHYQSFKTLIEEKVQFTLEDELYLLGDLLPGPRVLKLLDYILDLIQQGYSITSLMGNHEHSILKDISNGRRSLAPIYHNYLKSMKYFVDLDDVILVHAGFNTGLDYPPDDIHAMMWEYSWEHDGSNKWLGKRTVIHGHTVLPYGNIIRSIKERHQKIGIDNGVSFPGEETKGRMIAFDFENWNYWEQSSLD